jgi:hypothetical protein
MSTASASGRLLQRTQAYRLLPGRCVHLHNLRALYSSWVSQDRTQVDSQALGKGGSSTVRSSIECSSQQVCQLAPAVVHTRAVCHGVIWMRVRDDVAGEGCCCAVKGNV